jgi:DNA-binding transcriptional ArsR family regulator
METYSLQADLCKALAHPTRLQVLDLLSKKERSVEELTRLVGTGQSNLSQHLAALRQQKLVVGKRVGMNVYYELSNPRIVDACSEIRKLLAELLEDEHRAATKLEVPN